MEEENGQQFDFSDIIETDQQAPNPPAEEFDFSDIVEKKSPGTTTGDPLSASLSPTSISAPAAESGSEVDYETAFTSFTPQETQSETTQARVTPVVRADEVSEFNITGDEDINTYAEEKRRQKEGGYKYGLEASKFSDVSAAKREIQNKEIYIEDLSKMSALADGKLKARYGMDWEKQVSSLSDEIESIQAKITQAEKDGKPPAEIDFLIAQADEKVQRANAILSDESYIQIQKAQEGYERAVDEVKGLRGKYKGYDALMAAAERAQELSDQRSKQGGFLNQAALGVDRAQRFLGGLLGEASSLPRSIKNALPDTDGKSEFNLIDRVGSWGDEFAEGVELRNPAPTNLQRGLFENVVDFKGKQVVVDDDGNVQSVRTKDGYITQVPDSFIDEFNESGAGANAQRKYTGTNVLLDKVATATADLAVTIALTRGYGGIAKAAGSSMNTAGKIGTIVAVTHQTQDDAFREAIASGMDPDSAARFALASGVGVGAISILNPLEAQLAFRGTASKFTAEAAKALAGKRTAGDAFKAAMRGTAKNVAMETTEEAVLENIYDTVLRHTTNAIAGSDLETGISANEIYETALVSAVTSILPGAINSSKTTPGIVKESLTLAIDNIDVFDTHLKAMVEGGGMTQEEADASWNKINCIKRQLGSAGELDPEKKANVADAMYRRNEMEEELKGDIIPAIAQAKKDEIKSLDEFIKTELGLVEKSEAEGQAQEEKEAPATEETQLTNQQIQENAEEKTQETDSEEEIFSDEKEIFSDEKETKAEPDVLTAQDVKPVDLENEPEVKKPKAGARLFNEPVKEAAEMSDEYVKSNGIDPGIEEPIYELDIDRSKSIADEYEAMEHKPNDPEVKEAYEAMASETLDQGKFIIGKGYQVEIWEGEGEPYKNSEEMLSDLRDNKHMWILSTEKEFGQEPITEEERSSNPLLRDSGLTDKNGKTLLVNDVFRFVHDFFGHGKRGNGFGAKGEENAWDSHSRMYSDKARRAMTTETRGQNSWVNFGKHLRNPDGSIKKKGDEGYLSVTERPFADQKLGLLPEWVSRRDDEPEITRESVSEESLKPGETYEGDASGRVKQYEYEGFDQEEGVHKFRDVTPGIRFNDRIAAFPGTIFMQALKKVTKKPSRKELKEKDKATGGAEAQTDLGRPEKTSTKTTDISPGPEEKPGSQPPAKPPVTSSAQKKGKGKVSKRIPRVLSTPSLESAAKQLTEDQDGELRTYSETSLGEAEAEAENYIANAISKEGLKSTARSVIDQSKNLRAKDATPGVQAVFSIMLDKLLYRLVKEGDTELATELEIWQEERLRSAGVALVSTRNDVSPESLFRSVVNKVRKKSKEARDVVMEDGQTVGDHVDNFVEEVKKEFGLDQDEIMDAIRKGVSRSKASDKAKKETTKAKKELSDALSKLSKAIRKNAGSGPVINTQTANALSDVIRALVKVLKGSVKQLEARFKNEVQAAGMDPDIAWEYILENEEAELNKFRVKGKNLGKEVGAILSEEDIVQVVFDFYTNEQQFSDDLAAKIEDELGLSGDSLIDLTNRVQSEVKEYIKRKKGQRLKQITRKNERNPRKAKKIEDSLVEAIVLGGTSDQNIKSAIEEKYGIREIKPEEIQRLSDMVDDMSKLPGDRLKRRKMIEILDYVTSEIEGESAADVLTSLWFASVLSSPRTQVANFVGSLMNSMGIIYRVPGAGGIKGLQTMLNDAGFAFRQFAQIMLEGRGYRDMDKLIKTGTLERIGKRDLGQGIKKDITTLAAKGGRYVGRAMNAVDALFYYNHSNFRRGQLAYRQAKEEGLSGRALDARVDELIASGKQARRALIDRARKELEAAGIEFTQDDVFTRAREITEKNLAAVNPEINEEISQYAKLFTLQNKATGFMGSLARLLAYPAGMIEDAESQESATKKAGASIASIYSRVIFPFMNTAANMTNLAIDYVPVGGLVYKGIESAVPMGDLSSKTFKTPEDVRIFAIKQAIGLGLTMMLYGMLLDEEDDWFDVTANGPANYGKRNQLRSTGWKPFTIKIGDQRVNYRDWPVAGFLAGLGGFADAKKYEDAETPVEQMQHIWATTMGYFSNSSMLKTIGDLTGAVEEKDPSKLLIAATRPINGFMRPALARDIESLFSPEYKDKNKYSELPMIGRFIGNFVANAPIAGSVMLDPMYNAIGQTIKPQEAWWYRGIGFDRAVTTDKRTHPIFELMVDKGAFFPGIGRNIKIVGVEPSYEEYKKYTMVVGAYRRLVMENSMDALREMNKEDLEKFIKSKIDKPGRKLAESIVYEHQDKLNELTMNKIESILSGTKK